MRDYLPKEIQNEKRKAWYSGPERVWLRGALKEILKHNFLSNTPLVDEYLDSKVLRERILTFTKDDNPNRKCGLIWRVFNAEMWLRRFCF